MAGLPLEYIQLVSHMYENTMVSIKLTEGETQFFPSTIGLKQGCPLSPLLFNIYINDFEACINKDKLYGVNIGDRIAIR